MAQEKQDGKDFSATYSLVEDDLGRIADPRYVTGDWRKETEETPAILIVCPD
jgi:hypothetical protein